MRIHRFIRAPPHFERGEMALVNADADDLALALRDDSGALAHPGNAGIVATTGNSKSEMQPSSLP